MQKNMLQLKVNSSFKLFMFISIFFSGAVAFSAEMYGLLMVVKGDVKIIKTDQSVIPAKVGGRVLPKDSIVTGVDSRAKIVMSDRNVINVSPETKMEISKYVNDSQSGLKDVEIKLDQGKVRNNVEQAYDGEKSKFIMKTPTAVAGVRGTQFVTSFNAKTNVSSVVAIRGQVTFTSMANGKPVGSPVVVSKGEGVSAESGVPAPQPAPVSAKEMKEIDRDTSSSGKKSESSKQEGGTGPASGGNSGEKGDGSGDKKSSPNSDGGKTGAAGGAGGSPGGSTNMVDSGDLNPGMARDIKSQAPPPPPPGFNQGGPRPPTPPPTNNLVRDIIRENNGKTRVIIQPKTPTPNP